MGLQFALGQYSGLRVMANESMSLARYTFSCSGDELSSTLVIGISNSGEVARTLEALEIWRELGAQTLAYSSSEGSTLTRVAHHSLILPLPPLEHGPGLLGYVGSLLLGYATLMALGQKQTNQRLDDLIDTLPEMLQAWIPGQLEKAIDFANLVDDGVGVFLGSGPALGSADFGAAKVIEAAGERCWAQDLEEWAHLEYFCEPSDMPTVLLSSGGRSRSREIEIQHAAKKLGRAFMLSEWAGSAQWESIEREVMSPLVLWVAPCAYAAQRAAILSERPFRGFGGGRDRAEGGGASRIRSSERVQLKALDIEPKDRN